MNDRNTPGESAEGVLPRFGLGRRNRLEQSEHAATIAVPVAPAGEDDRFRGGALSPMLDEAGSGGRSGFRPTGWRVFDRALLLAEIVSAVVITWVVAQYIYTVYIDTTPHHLVGGRYQAPVSSAAGARVPALRTATSVPTPVPAPSATRVIIETPYIAGGAGQAFPGWPGSVPPATTQTATFTPTATPTVDPALLLPVRLRIPVMFLDSPVHEVKIDMGTWQVAPMDIGHHEGTANPGDTGNMVLAGHRDINSALFRELDRLKPGDAVYVSNSLREYKYVVTDSEVVTPDHTEVMDPTTDKRVTLITCTPIGIDTQRLIVTAVLDETLGTP